MTVPPTRELADVVNRFNLFAQSVTAVLGRQSGPRLREQLRRAFEKDGAFIRSQEESPMLATHPQSVTHFRDDDRGFFGWLEHNPDGYFINSERNPKPTYLVLHSSDCPHFSRSPNIHWTKDYVKFCSPDRRELEEWVLGTVGGEARLCRTCFKPTSRQVTMSGAAGLAPGEVLAGRYEVQRLLGEGDRKRTYLARGHEDGPARGGLSGEARGGSLRS